MVILLVLGMLLILAILTTILNDAGVAVRTFTDRARLKEANYQVARSAVELATNLLKVDDTDVDSGQDVWNISAERITWEGREFLLEIRDEESRFPLSQLPTTPDAEANADSQFFVDALDRLLTRAGLPQQSVAVLQDWMDPDDNVRAGGAEQGSYARALVKNGPLDDIDELEQLSGWAAPALPPPPTLAKGGERLEDAAPKNYQTTAKVAPGSSVWGDWLSAHATGKVNLNTAPAEVLRSLDTSMTDAVVTELTNRRSQKVLKNEEDLKTIPGIDADLAFRLGKVAGYASQVFRVRVVVTDQSTPLELEAMLSRQSQSNIQVLYWRAR